MNKFHYRRASDPAEATALLAEDSSSRIIAGGTDILPLMKEGITEPTELVDISHWNDERQIAETNRGVEIGALMTLSELAQDAIIKERYTALADACRLAAAPQLRNMGTIGGNLLQATRCDYFRGPYDCWLKGGDRCFARTGENEQHAIFLTGANESRCVSAHPSDPAAALLALGAEVRYVTPAGSAEVPLADFYTLPTDAHRTMVSLAPDAVITAVLLPTAPSKSLYRKAMPRATWSFAIAGVAIALRLDGGKIVEARVALSGVAPIPLRRIAVEEAIVGHALGDLHGDELMRLIAQGAQPLAQNGYKVQVVAGLFSEALHDIVS